MKKLLTVVAMVLVLLQVGAIAFASAATTTNYDANLIAHWDFEGTNPYADKATVGNSTDDLTAGIDVTVADGVATVGISENGYLLREVADNTSDLYNFQNKTVIMKVKPMKPDAGKKNLAHAIHKDGGFQMGFYTNGISVSSDSESDWDINIRTYDGGTAEANYLNNVNGNATKNYPGMDNIFHYIVISFEYDATAKTLVENFYYSKTEYPLAADDYIHVYTERFENVTENAVACAGKFLLGKQKLGNTNRGVGFAYDFVKIYNVPMTIEQAQGTLGIDPAAASSALAATTTQATTVATTKAATTAAATTKAATTAAATTAAATTAATTAAEEGGCGGVIAIPAVALVGVISAAGCMVKRKKR